MSMLGRVPLIVAGYLAAVAVASVIVIAPFWLSDPAAPGLVLFLATALVLTFLISLIPAVPVVIYAERSGRRGAGFYLLWGLAAGILGHLVLLSFVGSQGGLAGGRFIWDVMLVMGAAGCAAGGTYWGIAGRTAGVRRKPSEP